MSSRGGSTRGRRGASRGRPVVRPTLDPLDSNTKMAETTEGTAEDFINSNKNDSGDDGADLLADDLEFEDILTNPKLIQAVYDLFDSPSKIQAQAIKILTGENKRDLIAQAKTGSGKTLAFLAPVLECIDGSLKAPQAIILAPTRELVFQSKNVFDQLNKYLGYEVGLMMRDCEAPSPTVQVIFGTPSTVNGYSKPINQHSSYRNQYSSFDFSHIKMVIVDEADAIFTNESQFPPMRSILTEKVPETAVLGCFSATFSKESVTTIMNFRPKAHTIILEYSQQKVETVKHFYIITNSPQEKLEAVRRVFKTNYIPKGFIFCNTRVGVDDVHHALREEGLSCEGHHSNFASEERDAIFKRFQDDQKNSVRYLITTNALARGVNIPSVTLVLNYDIPTIRQGDRIYPDSDIYLHRSGRAGRFGKTGSCLSLVSQDELPLLKAMCGKVDIPLYQISVDTISNQLDEKDVSNEGSN